MGGWHRRESRIGVFVENDEAEDGREDGDQSDSVDDHEAITLVPCELEGGDYEEWDCGD